MLGLGQDDSKELAVQLLAQQRASLKVLRFLVHICAYAANNL